MKEAALINILYALLITLPPLISAPLNVYFLNEVLRYEIRRPRVAYLVSTGMGLVIGVSLSLLGSSLELDTVAVAELPYVLITLFFGFYLLFNMKIRGWRRIIVPFLSISILSNLSLIFLRIRDLVFEGNAWDDRIVAMAVYVLFNCVMLALEFLLFAFIARMRREKDDAPVPVSILVGIELILGLYISFMPSDDYADVPFDMDKPGRVIFMLSALALMTLLFYVRATRQERSDLRELNLINEELITTEAKYFEASVEANQKIRSIRHDMKNNVQVLKLLLENKEYDQMMEYLEEMGADLSGTDISARTGNTIADAILSEKREKAESLGITLNVEGVFSGPAFSPVDMCRILANMLDNAMEALSDEAFLELDPSYKVIDLRLKRTERFFMISMRNPCAKKPEITDDGIETGKSDRTNHGFGLRNIREAAGRYGGEMSLECAEKPYGYEFLTELVFPIEEA